MAGVDGEAQDRIARDAGALLAGVVYRAEVAVVAGGTVRGVGERDLALSRIAELARVARIWIACLVASAVDEARPGRNRVVAAPAGLGVARTGVVAGVRRRTGDLLAADAVSPAVAGVGLRAGVVVRAGRTLLLRLVFEAGAATVADVVDAGAVGSAQRPFGFVDVDAAPGGLIAGDALLARSGCRALDRVVPNAMTLPIAGVLLGTGVSIVAGGVLRCVRVIADAGGG